jgi:Flp pilus assembly protein TadG
MTLELVVLTPVVLIFALLVVGFGRLSHARDEVNKAAVAGARTASLASTPSQARTDAMQTVRDDLSHAGVSCATFTVDVDTSAFRPGGQVTVNVRCTARLSDVALAGFPGSRTFPASATSALEHYRDFNSGGGN